MSHHHPLPDYGWELVLKGHKRRVGCLNKGLVREMTPGKSLPIRIFDRGFGVQQVVNFPVEKRVVYPSAKKMLECCGLQAGLPGMKNIKEAITGYRKLFTEAEEKKYGMVVLTLGRPKVPVDLRFTPDRLQQAQEYHTQQRQHLLLHLRQIDTYLANIQRALGERDQPPLEIKDNEGGKKEEDVLPQVKVQEEPHPPPREAVGEKAIGYSAVSVVEEEG